MPHTAHTHPHLYSPDYLQGQGISLRPSDVHAPGILPTNHPGGAAVGATVTAGVDLTGILWAVIGFAGGYWFAKRG